MGDWGKMTRQRKGTAKTRTKRLILAGTMLLLGAGVAVPQNNPDPLKSGFENPPAGRAPACGGTG